MTDPWKQQIDALGSLIRAQRQLAQLSVRELAAQAKVSNAYLSQIERGLHEPSVRVLRSISLALGIPAETLLESAGLLDEEQRSRAAAGSTAAGAGAGATPGPAREDVEAAILADTTLTEEQKRALLSVYRSYTGSDAAAT